jgi:hypothetical protein
MKANEIYANFMWCINEGLMSDFQFRKNMNILEKRLTDNGIFIGGFTDVQVIEAVLQLNKLK